MTQREALEAIGHARDLFAEGDVLGTLGELETARGMIQDLIAAGVFRGVVVGEAQAGSGPPVSQLGEVLEKLERGWGAWTFGDKQEAFKWQRLAMDQLTALLASGDRGLARLGGCSRHPSAPVPGCSTCEAPCLGLIKAQMEALARKQEDLKQREAELAQMPGPGGDLAIQLERCAKILWRAQELLAPLRGDPARKALVEVESVIQALDVLLHSGPGTPQGMP